MNPNNFNRQTSNVFPGQNSNQMNPNRQYGQQYPNQSHTGSNQFPGQYPNNQRQQGYNPNMNQMYNQPPPPPPGYYGYPPQPQYNPYGPPPPQMGYPQQNYPNQRYSGGPQSQMNAPMINHHLKGLLTNFISKPNLYYKFYMNLLLNNCTLKTKNIVQLNSQISSNI